jgi:hypothetical protein
MKLDKILFATIVGMIGVVVALFLVPQVEGGNGVVHAEFSSMWHGGSGIARHGHVIWLGWLLGVASMVMFVVLMAFGARKGERLRGLGPPLLAGTAVYLGAWTWLCLAYADYLKEASHPLVAALPVPTAIMLYVLFPVSVVFNLFFVIGFKRWILSPEDFARYQRLLTEKRRRQDAVVAPSVQGEE